MKICLIAHMAYGALMGEEKGHIGGVERQITLFSRWLAGRGHDVSVVTWDEGGGKIEHIDGVKIIKLCGINDGLPGLRFFVPRWSSLINALKIADADIYYHNCAEYMTGQIALWAKYNNRVMIYSVASDADCQANLPNMRFLREKVLFKLGIKNSHLIIAQTETQKRLLHDNWNLASVVIPMPGTPPKKENDKSLAEKFDLKKIVWVGRLHRVKRVEWFLDIAQSLPEYIFEVVGPEDEGNPKIQDIRQRISELPNVNYRGKISREQMPEIYHNASLLCGTSHYEGFPNTYLEAWSYGVPVVTNTDPDSIIKSNSMGVQANTVEGLTAGIKTLLEDKSRWETCSKNSENYYLEHHQQDKVNLEFERRLVNSELPTSTQGIFDEESREWADYYGVSSKSISHLDLQRRREIASLFVEQSDLLSGCNVLDLGCGTGEGASVFDAVDTNMLVGVDFSERMVSVAKSRNESISTCSADAVKLPFVEKSFSGVLSLGLFEYIEDYRFALGQVSSVTTDNAVFVVSIPNRNSLFRLLRRFETKITSPLKYIKEIFYPLNNSRSKPLHQQWSLKQFNSQLEESSFSVTDVGYCNYGLLSPRLAESRINLKLCGWLDENGVRLGFFNRFLANTIIIKANRNVRK